jgi:pimeloyl-ACP methyl ester carboxylesterase
LGELALPDVVEHYADFMRNLAEKPVLIGHSIGGLIVQLLLQRHLAVAGIAIDSAPPLGVFTVSWPFLKSNWPTINPVISKHTPNYMPFEHFRYAFVHTLPLDEQTVAYEKYVVPESRWVAPGAPYCRSHGGFFGSTRTAPVHRGSGGPHYSRRSQCSQLREIRSLGRSDRLQGICRAHALHHWTARMGASR